MSLTLLMKSLLRNKLVTVLLLLQLAVTLALIVNSSLLAIHAHSLTNRPTGLDLDNTLVVELRPTLSALGQQPALTSMVERQLANVRSIPGVVTVAYASQPPFWIYGSSSDINDLDNQERSNVNNVSATIASTDIFAALDLKVIAGNVPTTLDSLIDFDTVDLRTIDIRTRSVVVTESLAKRLFGDQQPIGRFTNQGRVAAVVSDFFGQRGHQETYNFFTIEHLNPGGYRYTLILRVAEAQADAVRQSLPDNLIAAEPNVDILAIKKLRERRDELYVREKGLTMLLACLSVLMLVVAMISAYSSAFFHALKQQQEIGIKRALGASKATILQELYNEAWFTCALGCVLGIVVSLVLNRMLSSVLVIPEVPAWLPLLTSSLLLLCVTLASWYPAKIAMNISPVTATKSL